MCFALYLASNTPIPIIPWDENTRLLHTERVDTADPRIQGKFKYSNIAYIGTDTCCGCGFRNVPFQDGSWPGENWYTDIEESVIEKQPNHEQLVKFITENFSDQDSVELYGIWEGLPAKPILSDQTISQSKLLDPHFFFREDGHYMVLLRNEEPFAGI